MRKRLGLISIIVATLLVAFFVAHQSANREPSYQGRTLSQWIKDYQGAADYNQPKFKAAAHAVREIGTNAIPSLLKMLSVRDTTFKVQLMSFLSKQSWIPLHPVAPTSEREIGRTGFHILRKNAASAVPALILLTKDTDPHVQWAALTTLGDLNPTPENYLSILLQTFHDPSFGSRGLSAYQLSRLYPEEAEKASVYKEFPQFEPSGTNSVSDTGTVRK